jgi:hypothetical protein
MSTHRNRDIYDIHDATLKFVEIILAPLKPPERAEWAKQHLPRTFAFTLADRDFEVASRTYD